MIFVSGIKLENIILKDVLIMDLSDITANQQFVSILYFEAYNKVIYGVADLF